MCQWRDAENGWIKITTVCSNGQKLFNCYTRRGCGLAVLACRGQTFLFLLSYFIRTLAKKVVGWIPEPGAFLCGVSKFSVCENRFSQSRPASTNSPKSYAQGNLGTLNLPWVHWVVTVNGCKLATCPGCNRRLLSKKLQKIKPNQPNTCAHVHSSSVIHYLQTNRPLDNDHDARQPGAGKRGLTEQKRRIGFLLTIHQTRLPGLMNGCSRTVAGISLSESRFTSVRQINLTPGRACRAAADGEKKAQTDGCWWAPQDTLGETELTVKGCAWVRLMRVRLWPPRDGEKGRGIFFFPGWRKDDTVKQCTTWGNVCIL